MYSQFDLNRFNVLFNATLNNGGATANGSTGAIVRPAKGYAVSVSKGAIFTVRDGVWTIGRDRCTTAELFHQAVNRVLGSAPFIGTWIDNGKCYIDPVFIVDDLNEAFELAIAEGQLAFYDFGARQVIAVR